MSPYLVIVEPNAVVKVYDAEARHDLRLADRERAMQYAARLTGVKL
jgi:hypothetical protein